MSASPEVTRAGGSCCAAGRGARAGTGGVTVGGGGTAGATAFAIRGVGLCAPCFAVPVSLCGASWMPTARDSEATKVTAAAANAAAAPA